MFKRNLVQLAVAQVGKFICGKFRVLSARVVNATWASIGAIPHEEGDGDSGLYAKNIVSGACNLWVATHVGP